MKLLDLNDRFGRGFLAGAIGGIFALSFNLIVYLLNFSTLLWADFAGILTYGRKPINFLEYSFSLLEVFFFLTFLGVIFSILIKSISSKNLLLKGWMFGSAIWFFSYAATLLFKVPELAFIPLRTSFANLIGASIWGVLMAYSLEIINKRVRD